MDSITYTNEHFACLNYDRKELPEVRFTEFEKEVTVYGETSYNRIIFLISGKIEYSLNGKKSNPVNGGVMLYVPPHVELRLTALERCQAAIIHTGDLLEFREYFDGEENRLYNYLKDRIPPGMMEIHPMLNLYLTNFKLFYQDGIDGRDYLHNKVMEMFFLMRAYYDRTSIRIFFSLLPHEDYDFINKIISNWQRFRSARQLAEFMNCSESAFTRKFKIVFRENAGSWLANKRKQAVLHDLVAGREPLKVVAEKHLFDSQGLLTDFCRNNFGKPPGKIRKEKRLTVISE